jgi:hypothetical protein
LQEGIGNTAQQTDAATREFRTDRPLASLLSTTRDVLLAPQRFFDELPPDGPLGAPVLYFLICTAITTLINLIVGLAFLAVPVVFALATDSQEAGLLRTILAVFVFAFLVALPLSFVALFFVSVLLEHALIRLLAEGNQKGLLATVRASCYSVGAPVAIAWVPVVGLLAVIYCFYLHATALKRVHRISSGTSLAAILILVVLSLILVALVILYDYNVIREAMETPLSYYFPKPQSR